MSHLEIFIATYTHIYVKFSLKFMSCIVKLVDFIITCRYGEYSLISDHELVSFFLEEYPVLNYLSIFFKMENSILSKNQIFKKIYNFHIAHEHKTLYNIH